MTYARPKINLTCADCGKVRQVGNSLRNRQTVRCASCNYTHQKRHYRKPTPTADAITQTNGLPRGITKQWIWHQHQACRVYPAEMYTRCPWPCGRLNTPGQVCECRRGR